MISKYMFGMENKQYETKLFLKIECQNKILTMVVNYKDAFNLFLVSISENVLSQLLVNKIKITHSIINMDGTVRIFLVHN